MKKILILPILFGLCACKEQPMVQTGLVCSIYDENREKHIDVEIDFRAYEDYAVMSIAGAKEIKMPLVSEYERLGAVALEYYGEQWGMHLDLATESGIINKFFIHTPEGGPNTGYGCDVPVKYNSDKYVAPTELEKCIDFITDKVYLKDGDNPSAGLMIPYEIRSYHTDGGWRTEMGRFEVSADDAKNISQNWDYTNMKLYSLADGIQEYEQDACQVRYKLMQYMDWNEINKPRKVYVAETMSETETLVVPESNPIPVSE